MGAFFTWLMSLFSSNSSLNKLIVKVQAATVKACGFLPMAQSVAALVGAGNPGVATASAIAGKICAAATAIKPMHLAAMDGTSTPDPIVVDGVVIEGEFINPKE